jgi:hypothetical protein
MSSRLERVGITVNVNVVEWAAFLPQRRAGDYQISRNGWVFDYDDPSNFMECFQTGFGNNDAKYSNPSYDSLMAKGRREPIPRRAPAIFTRPRMCLWPIWAPSRGVLQRILPAEHGHHRLLALPVRLLVFPVRGYREVTGGPSGAENEGRVAKRFFRRRATRPSCLSALHVHEWPCAVSARG